MDMELTDLTDRQQRELDYHRERAKLQQSILSKPFSWAVLQNPERQWWNAYWAMFAYLMGCELQHKKVLVVGCGYGDDALRLAKLGARVHAFDLCPESLAIARKLAAREGLDIDFQQMAAEKLAYADDSFDCVLARDILHHVDIAQTMREIARVAKPDALFVVNEIYSHSLTERIRRSALVEKVLYPRMRSTIYGTGQPYITADERKLNESDLQEIAQQLQPRLFTQHFNFLVTRLIPDRFDRCAQVDRLLLRLLRPVAHVLAGRVLFSAPIRKPAHHAPS